MAKQQTVEVCDVAGCSRTGYRRVVGGVAPPRPRRMYGPNQEYDHLVAPEADGATGAEVVCDAHLLRLGRDGRVPNGAERLREFRGA